jgi:xylan 1,4-beta-xylosidase
VRGQPARTFCNPLDLDYGIRQIAAQASRHGADPAIVLYNDRYWLFSTWDKPGYRVSDDLIDWRYIPFAEGTPLAGEVYTAAAVVEIDGWLYYCELGSAKKRASLWRTQRPESGVWEHVRELPPYADPCLFVDPPTGRVFMYHGLERPIRVVELNRQTIEEIPGTDTQLMPAIDPTQRIHDGWEVCTWDNDEASPPMRGNRTFLPCREGAWMTYHDGRYYLQYASPGTTVPGYADGLLVGDNPLGPFEYSQHSPISRKASGFITSAGHSCLFQDRHGNWWRAVTMLIGVHERFERRIGLFPAGFDDNGLLYTRTELGDLPIILPDEPRDHRGAVHAGWWVISDGRPISASSSREGHEPVNANDENIRTWWSAETGDAGEWLMIDLEQVMEMRAVQVNLYEHDYMLDEQAEPEAHRYQVQASTDGRAWMNVVDRAAASDASPHLYVQFDQPVRTRFVRLENHHTPGRGKFAVSDLRVFGIAEASPPAATAAPDVRRDPNDRRKVTVSWQPVAGATSYLIRYGIDPDVLNQHHLVPPGERCEVTLHSLNSTPGYYFTIETLNDAGRTPGTSASHAP